MVSSTAKSALKADITLIIQQLFMHNYLFSTTGSEGMTFLKFDIL